MTEDERMTKKMIVVSGPSGAGKTTLVKYLMEKLPRLQFAVSATTRPLRGDEVNGRDYYFLSEDEFKEKVKLHEFLEHEEVYEGLLYGTLKEEIKRCWDNDEIPVLDIDVKGALNIKLHHGDYCLFVFVHPGDIYRLQERLKHRGTESDASLKKRLARAEEELNYSQEFDVVIYNRSLESASHELLERVVHFLNDEMSSTQL